MLMEDSFMLFFGTFDAIVLIASIYILFPHEHPEHKHLSVQHIHWAIDRFATMQDRNPLAKSAQGVLRAILAKFTKALSHSATSPGKDSETPCSTRGQSETTPASSSSRQDAHISAVLNPVIGGADSEKGVRSDGLQVPGETWLSPSEWAFAPDGLTSIMPTFATSDLIFNDLTAVPDGDLMGVANMDVTAGGGLEWQFGGDIGEGTLWQVLNQFQPR